jgi:hypothetical protein
MVEAFLYLGSACALRDGDGALAIAGFRFAIRHFIRPGELETAPGKA